MSFLDDATQENIDREIQKLRIEADIGAYEAQLLGEKSKLAQAKKTELAIKAKMSELHSLISAKKHELNSL